MKSIKLPTPKHKLGEIVYVMHSVLPTDRNRPPAIFITKCQITDIEYVVSRTIHRGFNRWIKIQYCAIPMRGRKDLLYQIRPYVRYVFDQSKPSKYALARRKLSKLPPKERERIRRLKKDWEKYEYYCQTTDEHIFFPESFACRTYKQALRRLNEHLKWHPLEEQFRRLPDWR